MANCHDGECPRRKLCRRYRADPIVFEPSYSQSPRREDACDEYWPFLKEKMQ